MRRSTHRLYPRALESRSFGLGSYGSRPFSAREAEALRIVTEYPGISIAELRDALGVSKTGGRQLVARLEAELVRRESQTSR